MRHFSSRAILGPQVSRNTSRGSQRAPHTILRCQMSALRQRPSLFLGGPEKGKQDKELVTNLEKTSYEAKMIPCPGTCSQQSADKGSTRLWQAKALVTPERPGSLASAGAPEGVRGEGSHSRGSTAGEASPGTAQPGLSSGCNMLRRRSPQPRTQPTIQDQDALLPDYGPQAMKRARVSGRALGGGESGDLRIEGHTPCTPCTHHACAVHVLCVCCACAVRVLCSVRLSALIPCIFVLRTSKGMVITEPIAPATMPPPSATYGGISCAGRLPHISRLYSPKMTKRSAWLEADLHTVAKRPR